MPYEINYRRTVGTDMPFIITVQYSFLIFPCNHIGPECNLRHIIESQHPDHTDKPAIVGDIGKLGGKARSNAGCNFLFGFQEGVDFIY